MEVHLCHYFELIWQNDYAECSSCIYVSFQVMRFETINVKESNSLDLVTLSPSNPREKWLRKRTQVKLRVQDWLSSNPSIS